MENQHFSHWILHSALCSARLSGSETKSGAMVVIPEGSIVLLDEDSSLAGIVSVVWRSETYEVFHDDLRSRGDRTSAAGRGA